jgi:hypothetical protein
MSVALQPTTRTPEKILVTGGGGTGKTRGAVDILRKCLLPGQTFRIVDNEQAFPIHLETLGMGCREEWISTGVTSAGKAQWERAREWEDPDSPVIRWFCQDWLSHREAISTMCADGQPGDWGVIDTMSQPWEDVQAWYVQTITGGEDFADWIVQNRVDQIEANKGNDGGAGAMLGEWKPINAQWKQYVRNPIIKTRSHLYLATHVKSINPHDTDDVKAMWKGLGFKADAQKSAARDVRTVLALEEHRGAGGGWKVTSVKDWERELLVRAELKSVPVTYLMGAAGWKMTKGQG